MKHMDVGQGPSPEKGREGKGSTRPASLTIPPLMAVQALMAVTDPMNILDDRYRIVWANHVRAKMHQRSLEEMLGRPCYEMFQRRTRVCEGCPVEETLRTGRPCIRERFADRPDGLRVWSETQAWPILDGGGRVSYVVEFARDITQFKQTELALRRSEMELKALSSQLLITQERERKRVSQELHDGVGQALTAIGFRLKDICMQLEGGVVQEEALRNLKAVIPLAEDAVEEVRRIAMGLRPTMLDDLGLLPTINWFCREYQHIYPIYVKKRVCVDEGDIPGDLKTDIYRIVQEALNNVAKHSRADFVSIVLERDGDGLKLVIEDNGMGFDTHMDGVPACPKEGGLGIRSMKERVEISGGSFSIESSRGAGTRITASWPHGCTPPTSR